MAHFAKLDNDNNVIAVHVVNYDVITVDGVESEQAGIDFLNDLYNETATYKQASYNGSFRKNYPGEGFKYDSSRDAFISPKPYESWILNEDTCRWEAPVAYPTDGLMHRWDEATTSWI
jgi:hypothetical protein